MEAKKNPYITTEEPRCTGSALNDLLSRAGMSKEPGVDIGICSECGWRGMLAECDTEQDGDWEHGYFESPLCPVCKDGGCIDDFDYSPQQLIKYNKFRETRGR